MLCSLKKEMEKEIEELDKKVSSLEKEISESQRLIQEQDDKVNQDYSLFFTKQEQEDLQDLISIHESSHSVAAG